MRRSISVWRVLLLTFVLSTSWGAAVVGASLAGPDPEAVEATLPEPDTAAPWWHQWSLDADGDRVDDDLRRLLSGDLRDTRTIHGIPVWSIHTDATGLVRADVFVRFDRDVDATDAERLQAQVLGSAKAYPLAQAVHVTDVRRTDIPTLLAVDGVVAIEAERTVVPALDVVVPASRITFSEEYGNGARARWQVTGHGIVIAVLDSGVDQEHEAFAPGRFLGGYDATVPTGSILGDTLLQERDPDDDVPSTHGTHVAGIALGVDPDGVHTGAAPEARLLDVKVLATNELGGGGLQSEIDPSDVDPALAPLDEPVGGISTLGIGSRIIEGLEFVARYNNGETYLGPPRDDTVHIVTLSVQELVPDEQGDTVLAHTVNRLVDTGVVVVAAAGNCGARGTAGCVAQGNATISAPGSAKQAITVAALDGKGTIAPDDDVVASFSSRGPNGGEPKPNIAAFGAEVMAPKGAPDASAEATNKYHALSGTSMAVPLVAGTAALMLELNRTLEPIDVKRLLMRSATDVADQGWDKQTGAGALNAMLALGLASGRVTLADIDPDDGHDHGDHVHDDELPEPQEQNDTLANVPPRVDFRYGPSVAQVGRLVVFIENVTDRSGDKIVRWNWDFGDGETASGPRVAHAFDEPGTYLVRLSATDVHGSAGHVRREVRVIGTDTGEAPGSDGAALLAMVAVLGMGTWLRRRATEEVRSP